MQLWLFDLDGTLVDTLPDLHRALTAVCQRHGRQPPDMDQMREAASRGVRAMLELSWGPFPDPSLLAGLREEFIQHYRAHLADHSRLMPGIPEVLEVLARRHQVWGIVTNKPAFLTHPLIGSLDLPFKPCVIVAADTSSHPKPHPAPLLDALSQARRQPHEAAFIGDAENDIVAGRAAGVVTLVALWGYLSPADHPESWLADGLLFRPSDLLAWLD
ncbi:phosphoglycolate phosphatase, bacterial [mine drainage metagenome]|uniref:Phosphoglycolate phosphatase, bacterial n=1 Tax=mine drainage metagenome TaxID=410659 RepID=T1AWK5_9ZZZZ